MNIIHWQKLSCTQAVAEELAKLLNVKAIEVADSFEEDADVILLGGGTYMHSMDKSLARFIEKLSSNKIKKIIPFARAGLISSIKKKISRLSVSLR